jgi:hypothetical protein
LGLGYDKWNLEVEYFLNFSGVKIWKKGNFLDFFFGMVEEYW